MTSRYFFSLSVSGLFLESVPWRFQSLRGGIPFPLKPLREAINNLPEVTTDA